MVDTKNTCISVAIATGALLLSTAACGTSSTEAANDVAGRSSALAIDALVFNLHCTSDLEVLGAQTRLSPTGHSGVFERILRIHDPRIVSDGDACILSAAAAEGSDEGLARYSTTLELTAGVPSAAMLLEQPVDSTATFTVRYPTVGVYRARLDFANRTISILPAAEPRGGDVAWAVPESVVFDGRGRAYRVDGFVTRTISRLDVQTGLPIWRRPIAEGTTLDSNCARANILVTRGLGPMTLIATEDGAPIWSTDLDGTLTREDVYAHPWCKQGLEALYVVHGNDAYGNQLSRIDLSTGRTLWSFTSPAVVKIAGLTRTLALVDALGREGRMLRAIDTRTGQALWSVPRTPDAQLVISEDHEDLDLVSATTIARLDPATGARVWVSSLEEESASLVAPATRLITRTAFGVAQIDRETGRPRWTAPLTDGQDATISVWPLASGRIAARVDTAEDVMSKLFLLDEASGAVLWTRGVEAQASTPVEDSVGRLYLESADKIVRLDPRGNTLWSFNLEEGARPREIGRIVDAGPDRVFLAFRDREVPYPRMGLLALDAITGARVWQYEAASALGVVAHDETRLFAVGGYGFETLLAILK